MSRQQKQKHTGTHSSPGAALPVLLRRRLGSLAAGAGSGKPRLRSPAAAQRQALSNAVQQRPCPQCSMLHALPAAQTPSGVGLVRSSAQSEVSRVLVLKSPAGMGILLLQCKEALWTDIGTTAPATFRTQALLHQATSSGSQARTPLSQRWLAHSSVPPRPELDGGHALRALQLLQEGQCPRLQVSPCTRALADDMLPRGDRWGLLGCLGAQHVCTNATTGAGPS